MKSLFSAIAGVFLFGLTTFGASPTLTNFNGQDFIVDAFATPTNVIRLRSSGGGAGTTNIFNTVIVTNLTVITNVTITTNITVVINGNTNQVGLWTLVPPPTGIFPNGTYLPTQLQSGLEATNIQSDEQLLTYGAFRMVVYTNVYALPPGSNVVTMVNAGAVWIGSDVNSTVPTDRIVSLDFGNGQGSIAILENKNGLVTDSAFILPAGSAISGGIGTVNLKLGDWAPKTQGDLLVLYNDGLNWNEIQRVSAPGGPSIIPAPFMVFLNLGGNPPPLDGSVTNTAVFDLDNKYIWYNAGPVNDPVWQAH